MKLEFKNWLKLKETGTSTACVAGFARPILGMVTRNTIDPFFMPKRKKKKKK